MFRRRILMLLALSLLAPSTASAWRHPRPAESRSIAAAAIHALHGSGWKARAVRVSTVHASYRYATASVDNKHTGVGGEMILQQRNGRWGELFLGTNDFCTARAPRKVLRDLGFSC